MDSDAPIPAWLFIAIEKMCEIFIIFLKNMRIAKSKWILGGEDVGSNPAIHISNFVAFKYHVKKNAMVSSILIFF